MRTSTSAGFDAVSGGGQWQLVPLINEAPRVAQFEKTRDRTARRTSPIDSYLDGWAEADLSKILDATAACYRFRDPFVGTFSRQSLAEYFDLLKHRLSRAGAVERRDVAFILRGPMDEP